MNIICPNYYNPFYSNKGNPIEYDSKKETLREPMKTPNVRHHLTIGGAVHKSFERFYVLFKGFGEVLSKSLLISLNHALVRLLKTLDLFNRQL
jgi:hypothetical protein